MGSSLADKLLGLFAPSPWCPLREDEGYIWLKITTASDCLGTIDSFAKALPAYKAAVSALDGRVVEFGPVDRYRDPPRYVTVQHEPFETADLRFYDKSVGEDPHAVIFTRAAVYPDGRNHQKDFRDFYFISTSYWDQYVEQIMSM